MRQGEGKHLFHISNDVFNFFLSLNKKLQCHLSDTAFHYYGTNMHCKCKLAIQSEEILVKEWFDLLNEAPGIDDSNENAIEIFTAVLLDLYEMMTDYFIKIALSNGLKRFKSTIPRIKKQALRSKIQTVQHNTKDSKNELSVNDARKRKFQEIYSLESQHSVLCCPVCNRTVLENPQTNQDQSIGCDNCNELYHYKCVSLKGDENCLKKKKLKMEMSKLQRKHKKKTPNEIKQS